MQPQALLTCQENAGPWAQSPAFQYPATQYCPQPIDICLTKPLMLAAPKNQHHASPDNAFVLSQRPV